MILDLSIQSDRLKAEVYFKKLLKDASAIELKKIHKRRTISQNSYLHKLCMLWGSEQGLTTDEAKITVKRALGYTYTKGSQEYFKKTSLMDIKELSEFIDRFRNWSSANGFYLPSHDEMEGNYAYYAKEIERAEYLEKRYGY